MSDATLHFLSHLHPYDALPEKTLTGVAEAADVIDIAQGVSVYDLGDTLAGLYIVQHGQISVYDAQGSAVSELGSGNSFGERGLLKQGRAVTSARAQRGTRLIRLPAALFHQLRRDDPAFARFYNRSSAANDAPRQLGLTQVQVAHLMVEPPVTCLPGTSISEVASILTRLRISCICVAQDDHLTGIATLRDLVGKSIAAGISVDAPISAIMTPTPLSLPPSALGSDVLHMMMEYRLGHLPIVEAGKLVGIVTQTDLTRWSASTSAGLVGEAARAQTPADMARATAKIPDLLAQLVGSGQRHDVVTRLVTDIADVVTRRLLALAEENLGPPPVPYLWLACGSQGRQEQTGVSDQDNCLILSDDVDDSGRAYFAKLAEQVCEGLNTCGYVYCPGDMMASNARWCQPLHVWHGYFKEWIAKPSKEAQMLASVMFDLRPIGGAVSLFHALKGQTLRQAAANSIFTAHMASNAQTHQTPLGLLRGLATIRAGEHRDTIDMKHSGVVPVVDLGRMYALQGQLDPVNTRTRLEKAIAAGVISESGGMDLLDAYDLVAQARLEHQAAQIKAGQAPDNFLAPATLSGFDRSHLRNAFVVIKTMQSALMQGRGLLA